MKNNEEITQQELSSRQQGFSSEFLRKRAMGIIHFSEKN